MLFQELLSEADREVGADSVFPLVFPEAPSKLAVPAGVELNSFIDDKLTLKRTICIAPVHEHNSTARIIDFTIPKPSTINLPRDVLIPRYNWERELQLSLQEADGTGPRNINNRGMPPVPYYSAETATRLTQALASTSYNTASIPWSECFQSSSEVTMELIYNTHDNYTPTEVSLDDKEGAVKPKPRLSAASAPTQGLPKLPGLKRQIDDSAAVSRNRRLLTSVANHQVATSHRNTKPDMTEHELRSFHRPRMPASLRSRPWILMAKGEKKKTHTARALGAAQQSSIDLSVSTGDFIVIEYFEETPPLVLNFGMSSIVVNYERPRESGVDQDEKRHKSMQSRTLKYETIYRLPRHVKLLMEKRDFNPIFEMDHNVKLKVGEPYLLEADEEFPFLGALLPGEVMQTFKNELFRSPLFAHTPRSTDFLITRTKIAKDSLSYAIRPIKRLFVSGQTEPLEVVPKPAKALSKTQENFFLLGAARYFAANPNGVEWSDLRKELIKSSFSKEKTLESILHRVAVNERYYDAEASSRSRVSRWFPNPEVEPTDLEKMFTPKEVCLHESSVAADYKMARLGLENLDLTRIGAWLAAMSDVLKFKKEKAVRVIQFADSCKDVRIKRALVEIKRHVIRDVKELDERLEIARFIRRFLLSCPWNTTEAFKERHSTVMEISDPFDPSGRIKGFQYVKKRVVDMLAKQSERLQGTKSDLRKLTKKEAIDLLLDLSAGSIPREVIVKMPRWARIREIGTLSKKALIMGTGQQIHKFARNVKSNFFESGGGDEFKRFFSDCQLLWNTQKAALASTSTAEDAEEDEEEDDEFGEEDIEQELASEAQSRLEEEFESTERESVSVADFLKDLSGPKKPQVRIDGSATPLATPMEAPVMATRRPLKVVKRTTRSLKDDGTEIIEIEYLVSEREVERVEAAEAKKKSTIESLKRRTRTFDGDFFVEDYSAAGSGQLNLRLSRSKATLASMRLDQELQEDMPERVVTVSRRTKGVVKDYRLPHVLFAVKLETILKDVWNRTRISWDFMYPVNGAVVKGYYDKIKHPICLSDIRERVARFQYVTVRSFMEDVELLAANAVEFNGKDSEIAKNANTILRDIEGAVNHERKTLGAHKDTLAILEEAIVDKFDYLRRPLPRKPTYFVSSAASVLLVPPVETPVAVAPIVPEVSLEEGEVAMDIAGGGEDGSSSGEEEVIDEG